MRAIVLAMVRALWRLMWLGGLCVVLGVPPLHAQERLGPAQRRANAVLAASERALAAGRSDLALRTLTKALTAKPSMQLLLRYGELAVPLEGPASKSELALRVPNAEPFLTALARLEIVESKPDEVRRALLHAAVAEALRAQYDRSFAFVHEAGRLQDGATILALRSIAAIAAYREQLAVATRALEDARQYMPQDLQAMAELGRIELARGRVQQALRVFKERFGIEPERLAARRDLAYALLSTGRAEEALSLLAAAEGCSVHPSCALEAARAALAAERSDIAISYARARLHQGADVDALFVVADAHVRLGQFPEARAAYREILQLQPSSLLAQQALEQLPRAEVDSNAATR